MPTNSNNLHLKDIHLISKKLQIVTISEMQYKKPQQKLSKKLHGKNRDFSIQFKNLFIFKHISLSKFV